MNPLQARRSRAGFANVEHPRFAGFQHQVFALSMNANIEPVAGLERHVRVFAFGDGHGDNVITRIANHDFVPRLLADFMLRALLFPVQGPTCQPSRISPQVAAGKPSATIFLMTPAP